MKKTLIALALCASSLASAAQAAPLSVGDVVTFSNAAIVCQSRDLLRQAINAASNETEQNKAIVQRLFGSENGQGPCVMIGPESSARVLSVEYNEPRTPDIGIMEIAGEQSALARGQGAWALTIGAKKAR